MSLPIYQHINVRSIHLDDLKNVLHQEINLKHPVALNLKALEPDQQREIIGLIENFFVSHNISYKFPYPVYLVMDFEPTITQMPSAKSFEDLPKFYSQKDSKMNVKESYLASKNRLLQQEIKNADALGIQNRLIQYGSSHRKLFDLENERLFCMEILGRLRKDKKSHG
jgi:hypothetical protein